MFARGRIRGGGGHQFDSCLDVVFWMLFNSVSLDELRISINPNSYNSSLLVRWGFVCLVVVWLFGCLVVCFSWVVGFWCLVAWLAGWLVGCWLFVCWLVWLLVVFFPWLVRSVGHAHLHHSNSEESPTSSRGGRSFGVEG